MEKYHLLYLKLFFKKIKDMKLKTKIRIFLFLITILSIIGIGFYSYHIARRELIDNSKQAVLNIEKLGAASLDSRIDSFQESTYQVLKLSNIEALLNYSHDAAEANRIQNEGLPAAVSQQKKLWEYIDYCLLRPNSGMVYDFYKSGQQKLNSSEQEKLLDDLSGLVSKRRPIIWTKYKGKVYFIRKIISEQFEEKGVICFAINDRFFKIIDEGLDYMNDDNLIILNQKGELLKAVDIANAEDIIKRIEPYQKKHYYTYNIEKEIEGRRYTVLVINTSGSGWTIISFFSHDVLLRGIEEIFYGILELIIIVLLIVVVITGVISRTITRNVNIIEEGMKHYEAGAFDYRVKPVSYDEVGLLGLQLNYMAMKISELIQMLQLKEEEKKKLEVETLQAQINPHFLYNTLGSLKWAAIRENQKELAGALDALIQLLRFTIKKAGSQVTIEEEIKYIQNYIEVEKMRFGNQFSMCYEIDEDTKSMLIPGFVLQPLVENSLLHGIDMSEDDGIIVIRSYIAEEFLMLEVEDNGKGIETDEIGKLLTRDEKVYKGFNSIGLKIVDKRLVEIYGNDYKTTIHGSLGEGIKIALHIPLGEIKNEESGIDS